MDTARRDSGSIVVGWLTKIAVIIAVVGILLFDTVSVSTARLGATDDANQAAFAAGAARRLGHNLQSAYNAAVQTVTNPQEHVLTRGFTIDADGTVHLLLRRTTKTLVLEHIAPLQRRYGVFTVSGEAAPPTS